MALIETEYCSNLTGYQLGSCITFGTGGVNKVYISQFSASTVFQYSSDNTITGMTNNPQWYIFDCFIETAEGNEDGKINLGNASQGNEQKINILFPKGTAAIRNQFMGLINQVSRLAIHDMNGDVRIYGISRGLYCTNYKTKTGKISDDGSAWTVELTAKEKKPAPFCTSTSTLTPTPTY